MDIKTIISSIFIPIIVAYLAARAAGYSKNVTEERKLWRERIRTLAMEAFEALKNRENSTTNKDTSELNTEISPIECRKIYVEFSTRLNPHDLRDKAIISYLKKCLCEKKCPKKDKIENELKTPPPFNINTPEEFLGEISRLLKHDWDRAVWETRIIKIPNFKNIRKICSPSDKIREENYNKEEDHHCWNCTLIFTASIIISIYVICILISSLIKMFS